MHHGKIKFFQVRFLVLCCYLFLGTNTLSAQDRTKREKAIGTTLEVVELSFDEMARSKAELFENNFSVKLNYRVKQESINAIGGLSKYLLTIFQEISYPGNTNVLNITGEFAFANQGQLSDTVTYQTKVTKDLGQCIFDKERVDSLDKHFNTALNRNDSATGALNADFEQYSLFCVNATDSYGAVLFKYGNDCPKILGTPLEEYQTYINNTTSNRAKHWHSSIAALSQELYMRHENIIGGGIQKVQYNPNAAVINMQVKPNVPEPHQIINLNNSVNECTRLDMESRARLLFAKTNVRFLFLTQSIDFFIPPDSIKMFGDSVCQKILSSHPDKNLIIALWLKLTDNVSKKHGGQLIVRQNGEWLTNADIEFAKYNNGGNYNKGTFHKFNSLMRNIPKPLIICYQVAKVNGLITTVYLHKSAHVKGSEQIYNHIFKVDKDLDEIDFQIGEYKKAITPKYGKFDIDGALEASKKYKYLLARALLQPELTEAKIHFKEEYLQDSLLVIAATEKFLQKKYPNLFGTRLGNTKALIDVPDDIAVGSCKPGVSTEVVAQALMVSSALLSPVGLDLIPDALSVVYFAAVGDYKSAFLSGLSMLTPANLNLIRSSLNTGDDFIRFANSGAYTHSRGAEMYGVSAEYGLISSNYQIKPQAFDNELFSLIKNQPETTKSLLLIENEGGRIYNCVEDLSETERVEVLKKLYKDAELKAKSLLNSKNILRAAWNLTEDEFKLLQFDDFQASLNAVQNLMRENKLNFSTGSASFVELAAIHRYTKNGGILNTPMRADSETMIGAVKFNEYERLLYQHVVSGLEKLRNTGRKVDGMVLRGRTYSLEDFNTLFGKADALVPLKGFVSCSTKREVAEAFFEKTDKITGARVKVIFEIKSKKGVFIDDLSDWGVNLVEATHVNEIAQWEVLLQEGLFKMSGKPQLIKFVNANEQWYKIVLEETEIPLRKF